MKKLFGFTMILAAVGLFSCQEEKIDIPDEALISEKAAQITLNEVSMESALTETEYEIDFYSNAIGPLFMQQRMGQLWRWSNKLRYGINQCPSVEIESEGDTFPKTITLDYGEGTELQNGKVLSGVIIIEISAPRYSTEYQRNVTYENFGVNGILITEGSSVVTVNREEETFRTFASNMTFVLEDGTEMNRKAERTWQWIEGMDTELDQTDDVIQITGFAEATTSEGESYRKEIVAPLVRIRDCRFIVQGTVDIIYNGDTSALDYGDGTCDAVAELTTSDGEIIEIDLAEKRMNRYRNQQGNENGMGLGNGNGNQGGGMNG